MISVTKWAVLGALGVALLCSAQDAPDAATQKAAKIRELMQLTGSAQVGKQMMDQMGAAMGQRQGPVFQKFWKEFSAGVDVGEIQELVVPIYAKHFEIDDIEELIRFYSSPTGKKFVQAMPAIAEESVAVGMEWGQELAERALERFEGFDEIDEIEEVEELEEK